MSNHILRHAVIAGFTLVASCLCCAADTVIVDPDGGAACWTVEPSTGRVFAALVGSDKVVEYDATGAEVRQFTVGINPQELLIKGDWLVVACQTSPALHFINLKSGKNAGIMPFKGEEGPRALFGSSMDNPYIYCVIGRSSSGTIFQIDVGKQEIRNQGNLYGWGQSSVYHVAMSPDGRWIVPDARGRISPSGADLMKVDEDEFTFTQIRDYHSSFGQMVPGPFNRHWTFGDTLYPLDISAPMRKFSGAVVRIHPRWNLAASYSPGSLFLERFNDAGKIETISLEPSNNKPVVDSRSRRSRTVVPDSLVQFDLKHELVFVGTRYRGYWVDLKERADQLKPNFVLRAPTEVSHLIGTPMKVALQISNANADRKLNIVKKDGPESVKVNNVELTWMPKAKDVGIQTVHLELTDSESGDVLDRARLKLHVKLPKVEIGFPIKSMQRSPDNRFAVIWGPSKGQEGRHPAHTGSDDVAVVDITARKIIAKKSIPSGLRTAAIDDKYVYLAPNSGDLFYRVSHRLENHKRQFLKSSPQRLFCCLDHHLLVTGGESQLFDVEQMKPATLDALTAVQGLRPTAGAIGEKMIRVGPRIVDRNDGRIIRLDARAYLPLVVPNARDRNRSNIPLSTVTPWGRRTRGNQITNYKGNVVAHWSGGTGNNSVIADKYPMAVAVFPKVDSSTRETSLVMQLRNLIDGEVEHEAVLDVQAPSRARRSPSFYGTRELLAAPGDSVILAYHSDLLIADIPEETAAKIPVPVHFLAQQATEIEVGKPVDIPLRVGGDSQGTQFTLLAEYPAVSLDAETGVVTVDTVTMWNSFIDSSPDQAMRYVPGRPPGSPSMFDQAENAKRYKILTGKELAAGKLAAYLPISAALQDKEGQQDSIQLTVVVVGPRTALDESIARRKAEQEKQRAEALEMQRKAQEARQKQLAQKKSESETIQQRLDNLEESMKRIEGTMEKILKRLENQD